MLGSWVGRGLRPSKLKTSQRWQAARLADHVLNGILSALRQSFYQVAVNGGNKPRPPVDESGVYLDQGRAGTNHLPGVFPRHDPPDANDRDGAPRLAVHCRDQ